MKNVLLFLLNLSINCSFGQSSVIDSEKENPFFVFDYKIYNLQFEQNTSKINKITHCIIDTFNVCRKKNSKIKSLKIFYFDNNDTNLRQNITYNTNGLIKFMTPGVGWYTFAKVEPDVIQIDCNQKNNSFLKNSKKENIKNVYEKIEYEYDINGFLISCTTTTKGIINRWLKKNIGAVRVKYKTSYHYNSDYSEVIVIHQYYNSIFSKHPLVRDKIYCKFDKNGNLLSETKYFITKDQSESLIDGFIYSYTFYEE